MAGPRIDDGARRYAWEEGAIVSLLPPAEYADRLRAAGFVAPRHHDLTATAEAFFARVAAATEERRAEVERVAGQEGVAKWREIAAHYGRLFRERQLVYGLTIAHCPGGDENG
jgi:hypothetical protein